MLPQYMALSITYVSKKKLCVRSLGYIVGASNPPVKICVSVRWVTLWIRPPLCVSVQFVTLWVRPHLMCVLSLEDNLCWILACCLLHFEVFFKLGRTPPLMTCMWHKMHKLGLLQSCHNPIILRFLCCKCFC